MGESEIVLFIFQALSYGIHEGGPSQFSKQIPKLSLILTSVPGIFLLLINSYLYLSPVHLLHLSTNANLGKPFLTH